MFEVASQIIICLILAALLGWIIGYLMGKATCSSDNDCHKGRDNSHELHIDNNSVATVMSNTNIEVGTQPILLAEAREEGKDNLQLIKGVGKVLEELLNKTGIYHFDQISNLSTEEVSWLDNSMSFPGRIEREEWVVQAKDLAEGKSTEFSARVERGEVSSSNKS
jgi:predicted flap endonuclease-1-like 5' DNA nuclease